ncbi:hypothetical protein HOY82DRAFT_459318, partial [Tuber indicum]
MMYYTSTAPAPCHCKGSLTYRKSKQQTGAVLVWYIMAAKAPPHIPGVLRELCGRKHSTSSASYCTVLYSY